MGELKNREPFSTTLLKWHAKSIRKLSADTRISMTKLIDEALNDLLNKYGIEKEEEPNQNN